jgi:hypothetical protein
MQQQIPPLRCGMTNKRAANGKNKDETNATTNAGPSTTPLTKASSASLRMTRFF